MFGAVDHFLSNFLRALSKACCMLLYAASVPFIISALACPDAFCSRRSSASAAGLLFPAREAVLSCDPDFVVLGMSAETFWDGLQGSQRLKRRLEKTAKRGVAMGSDACRAALRACGRSVRRLGVITPYMPIGDRQVRK